MENLRKTNLIYTSPYSDCCICTNDFYDQDTPIEFCAYCGNNYHTSCIMDTVSIFCPYCHNPGFKKHYQDMAEFARRFNLPLIDETPETSEINYNRFCTYAGCACLDKSLASLSIKSASRSPSPQSAKTWCRKCKSDECECSINSLNSPFKALSLNSRTSSNDSQKNLLKCKRKRFSPASEDDDDKCSRCCCTLIRCRCKRAGNQNIVSSFTLLDISCKTCNQTKCNCN